MLSPHFLFCFYYIERPFDFQVKFYILYKKSKDTYDKHIT